MTFLIKDVAAQVGIWKEKNASPQGSGWREKNHVKIQRGITGTRTGKRAKEEVGSRSKLRNGAS